MADPDLLVYGESTLTVDTADHVRSDYRAVLRLIGFGFFVQALATDGGIASLPLRLLLKNHLHMLPTAVAGFSTIANVAWYLKPIAGMFADTVKIRGSRYRNYLSIGSLGAAIGWLLMGVVPPTYGALLGTFVVVNVLLMLISTVLGGYLVTKSRALKATGRMASFRTIAMGAAGFVAGPAAGFLATRAFGLTAGIDAALLVMLFVYVRRNVAEAPSEDAGTGDGTVSQFWTSLKSEIQPLLRARTFWAAVGMTFLVVITPGFGTLLLYYQQDTLHFTSQFIGNLSLVGGITGTAGIAAYIILCRRLSLRNLLYLALPLAAAATALFVLYRSPTSAIVIVAVSSLVGAIPNIALFDLAARASPIRSASLSYSLLMAVANFGTQLSDVGGSWLHERFHVALFTLVWVNAGTTLLTVIAVPFLPKALVNSSDGGGPAESAG